MTSRKITLFFLLFLCMATTPLCAASLVDSTPLPSITARLFTIAALSLLPFAIMLLTSFMKIAVVLSLFRQAIGIQQSPPNQVLSGIALLMTIYVMFPTGMAIYSDMKPYMEQNAPKGNEFLSGESANYILGLFDHGKKPIKLFLQKNSVQKHIQYFYQLAYAKFPEAVRKDLSHDDMIILAPAFITSQLKSAFEIGVLIYLPFFIIDLVTSNILLAMGMMMLSPLTIALPLKLLLLVMVDGWTLLIQGMVLGYK